jgi:hypothetical protein
MILRFSPRVTILHEGDYEIMKTLKIRHFGTNAQGIKLKGDKRNPEPEMVLIDFPGGKIELTRCTDDSYWVHVIVNGHQEPAALERGQIEGVLIDENHDKLREFQDFKVRIGQKGKHEDGIIPKEPR